MSSGPQCSDKARQQTVCASFAAINGPKNDWDMSTYHITAEADEQAVQYSVEGVSTSYSPSLSGHHHADLAQPVYLSHGDHANDDKEGYGHYDSHDRFAEATLKYTQTDQNLMMMTVHLMRI